MKASKEFNFYVNGNVPQTIKVSDEVPEIAQDYAVKNGYAEKSKSAPKNKAKITPQNKAK